jgi:hypothetical protein
MLSFRLEPARPHAIKALLALDKVVPTHVDRTIVATKRNSATSSKEDTDKKEKQKEKKCGEYD